MLNLPNRQTSGKMALDATIKTQQEHDQQQQQNEKGHKNRLSNYLSNLLYNNKNSVINKTDLTKEFNCKNGGSINFILNDEKQKESRIIPNNDFQAVELR